MDKFTAEELSFFRPVHPRQPFLLSCPCLFNVGRGKLLQVRPFALTWLGPSVPGTVPFSVYAVAYLYSIPSYESRIHSQILFPSESVVLINAGDDTQVWICRSIPFLPTDRQISGNFIFTKSNLFSWRFPSRDLLLDNDPLRGQPLLKGSHTTAGIQPELG